MIIYCKLEINLYGTGFRTKAELESFAQDKIMSAIRELPLPRSRDELTGDIDISVIEVAGRDENTEA